MAYHTVRFKGLDWTKFTQKNWTRLLKCDNGWYAAHANSVSGPAKRFKKKSEIVQQKPKKNAALKLHKVMVHTVRTYDVIGPGVLWVIKFTIETSSVKMRQRERQFILKWFYMGKSMHLSIYLIKI